MPHKPAGDQKGEWMPDLHFTTLIEGSAETVFALIADLAHYDRWLPGSKAFGAITQISPLPVLEPPILMLDRLARGTARSRSMIRRRVSPSINPCK